MAEGYTYLVEGEANNAERDSIEDQFGGGRGLFFRPLEPRTPGPIQQYSRAALGDDIT